MRWLVCLLCFGVATMCFAQPVSRLWIKTTSLPGTDTYSDLFVDAQGNSYVCGSTSPGVGVATAIAVKFDRNGVKLWERSYPSTVGGSWARSVAVDAQGNVILAGFTKWVGNDRQSWVAKVSPTGVLLWERTGNATVTSSWYDVAVDSVGEISLTGDFNSTGLKMRTSHYLADGTWVWNREYTYPGLTNIQVQSGFWVEVDASRNIYVCGVSYGNNIFNNVAKYSPAGTLLWLRHQNDSNRDYPRGFLMYGGSNCAMITEASGGGTDAIYLTTYDTNGVRTSHYGGSFAIGTADRPHTSSFIHLPDGSFVTVGNIQASFGTPTVRSFRAVFKGGSVSIATEVGQRFGMGAAAGLTGGEYYFSSVGQSVASSLVNGVLPSYPWGNPNYSWSQSVFGSTANGQTPAAFMQILRVDPRGDLLAAGQFTGANGYDGLLIKYELNPVAGDDAFSTQTGQALTRSAPGLHENDSQASQATLALTQAPMHGTLTAFNEGSFSYVPNAGFAGVDRAYYKLTRTNGVAPYTSFAEAVFTVYPTISNFVIDPPSVKGGNQVTLRVAVATRLSTALTFPITGQTIHLGGNFSSITVPKESTVGEQVINTIVVATTETATLTVRSGTSTRSATLTITP